MMETKDDITDADVAAGYWTFYAGFAAGVRERADRNVQHLRYVFARCEKNEQMREFVEAAVSMLELEWLAESKYDAFDDAFYCEEIFESWRKVHPRDPGSRTLTGDERTESARRSAMFGGDDDF